MRKTLNMILAASVILYNCSAAFALDANTLPTLNSAVGGDIAVNGSNMNVNVNAAQGGASTYNWGSYNIGSNAAVNYQFNNYNQTAINKVDATGGMSQIYGQITNSGIGAETGKIFLFNPNGVLFGQGCNVNVNSFTVSSFDGKYDEESKTLELTKGANAGNIYVDKDAKIYGDKGVNIVAPNVTALKGSLISTSNVANDGTRTFGKVKIVTGDGVNFKFYNNGGTKELISDSIKTTTDTNKVILNGEIASSNIDIRNAAVGEGSGIYIEKATLKADKAVQGEDGCIYLTSNGKIVVDDSVFTTSDQTAAASTVGIGQIAFLAGDKVSVTDSTFKTTTGQYATSGNVSFTSAKNDSVVKNSTINAAGDVLVTAKGVATIQGNSNVKANNVVVNGDTRAQINNSKIYTTQDVTIASANSSADSIGAWVNGSNIEAKNVNISANGSVQTEGNAEIKANNLTIKSAAASIDMADTKATIKNTADANAKTTLTIANSTIDANTINATAGKDITNASFAGSKLTADKINATSTEESIILSDIDNVKANRVSLNAAKDVSLTTTNDFEVSNVDIAAENDINLNSTQGSVVIKDVTLANAKKVNVNAAKNITTEKTMNVKGMQANLVAGKDIDVTLANADDKAIGLTAKGENVTLRSEGALSISSAIASNDLTLDSNGVVAGLPYTTEGPVDAAGNPRSYLEAGNKFYSKTDFEKTASFNPTADGKYNQRHHIQYGANGEEKILLVTKYEIPQQPVVDPTPNPVYEEQPAISTDEANKLNRLPLQPEQASRVAPIADNRTNLVDVFAAASQIEIEDENAEQAEEIQ